MKVKKTIVKKYSEGTASVEAKPKKMNFFKRLKAKEDESAKIAESIDAQDSAPKQEYNITQEKSFVGPQLTGLDKAVNEGTSDNAKLDAVAKTTPATKTNLTKGADAKLAAWQSKRGLVADGIWGAKSEEAYKKEQAAKAKKMALKKTTTPTETKTTIVTNKPIEVTKTKGNKGDISEAPKGTYVSQVREPDSLPDAMGIKRTAGKYYKNEEVEDSDWSKGYDSVSSLPAGVGKYPSGESYPHVKGKPMNKSASKITVTKSTPKETQKKSKLTYDSTRGGMPWNHYKTEEEIKESKKPSSKKSEGFGNYFNSIPNLDYSKFPKTKKK